jgi:hypothetical protein
MIKIITYPIKDLFLTKGVLSTFIGKFWNEVFSKIIKLDSKQHLMILVKVEFTEEEQGYRTLGHLRSVNFKDKDQFINYIVERLSILNESYTSIIKEGIATGTRVLLQDMEEKVSYTHRFNNMNLPVTMNPSEYGDILGTFTIEGFTRYIVKNITRTFKIDVSLDKLVNNVTLFGVSDLNWTDTVISDVCFKREIGKSTIYFLDGVEVLRKQTLTAKAFRRLKAENKINEYFATIDIETIKKGDQQIPYLICGYNGSDYITSYAKFSVKSKITIFYLY